MKSTSVLDSRVSWLLDTSRDPMLVCDGAGVIVQANEALATLVGWDEAGLRGQQIEVLVPAAQRARHAVLRTAAAPAARALGSGAGQFTAVDREGNVFPVEVSLSPLQTDSGGMLTLATVYDLRARLSAEQALRDSEARMRAVFETAVDAIVTIDEEGRIERVNRAAERMFGYAEAELAGHNVAVLMPAPDRDRHDTYLRHYLQTGERRIIGRGREVQAVRKDGTVFPVELSVAEMLIGGRRMFTGLLRDISQRKLSDTRTERLLSDLRSANEELSSFAYVVSHDLKAPLRAIGSLADWLATDYADRFDDEGREHLRLLMNRVHRMGSLIDGILQYSRVGRSEQALVEVDIKAVLDETLEMLAVPSSVTVTVDADLPRIVTEPTRIRQVFSNLVSNAIKYMDKPEGRVHVGFADDGASWHFSVSDNGSGIESRHFERIFQLFQTLAPRDRIESTGVGLALVRKIVDMAGGRVWVESRPGEGSIFHFTYPKAPRAPLDRQ